MRERDIAAKLDAVLAELERQRSLLERLARRLAPELVDPVPPSSGTDVHGRRFLQGTGWTGPHTSEADAERLLPPAPADDADSGAQRAQGVDPLEGRRDDR